MKSLRNSPVARRILSVTTPVVGLIWFCSKLLGLLRDAGLPTS